MLTIEEYESKRQARYERLLKAAERAASESSSAQSQARAMADIIPFGQPILVGHHSEKRDRNYRERINNKFRKGYELAKKAEELRSRAASVEANNAIYTEDPQAVEKLESKLETLLKEQAEIKRINAALRKGADFATLEMSDEHRRKLLSVAKFQAYYNPLKKGFPPYILTSINAKIKTAKQRAEVVEKKQAMRDEDFTVNGIRVEGRPSENRLRVYYPGRVDAETFRLLRQHGFRVLRSEGEGAFSAYYNNNAVYFVKTHIMMVTFPNTDEGEKAANQYMEANEAMAVIEVTSEEIRLKEVAK